MFKLKNLTTEGLNELLQASYDEFGIIKNAGFKAEDSIDQARLMSWDMASIDKTVVIREEVTPLILAIMEDVPHLTKILLTLGADINLKNKNPSSESDGDAVDESDDAPIPHFLAPPLLWALKKYFFAWKDFHEEMSLVNVSLLLSDPRLDINLGGTITTEESGQRIARYHTPLTYILESYDYTDEYAKKEILDSLLDLILNHPKLNVNEPAYDSLTPMHFALLLGNQDIILRLMELNAKFTSLSPIVETAFPNSENTPQKTKNLHHPYVRIQPLFGIYPDLNLRERVQNGLLKGATLFMSLVDETTSKELSEEILLQALLQWQQFGRHSEMDFIEDFIDDHVVANINPKKSFVGLGSGTKSDTLRSKLINDPGNFYYDCLKVLSNLKKSLEVLLKPTKTLDEFIKSEAISQAIPDTGGLTPLMWCAHYGHKVLAAALLIHGANFSERNSENESALTLAIKAKRPAMIRLFSYFQAPFDEEEALFNALITQDIFTLQAVMQLIGKSLDENKKQKWIKTKGKSFISPRITVIFSQSDLRLRSFIHREFKLIGLETLLSKLEMPLVDLFQFLQNARGRIQAALSNHQNLLTTCVGNPMLTDTSGFSTERAEMFSPIFSLLGNPDLNPNEIGLFTAENFTELNTPIAIASQFGGDYNEDESGFAFDNHDLFITLVYHPRINVDAHPRDSRAPLLYAIMDDDRIYTTRLMNRSKIPSLFQLLMQNTRFVFQEARIWRSIDVGRHSFSEDKLLEALDQDFKDLELHQTYQTENGSDVITCTPLTFAIDRGYQRLQTRLCEIIVSQTFLKLTLAQLDPNNQEPFDMGKFLNSHINENAYPDKTKSKILYLKTLKVIKDQILDPLIEILGGTRPHIIKTQLDTKFENLLATILQSMPTNVPDVILLIKIFIKLKPKDTFMLLGKVMAAKAPIKIIKYILKQVNDLNAKFPLTIQKAINQDKSVIPSSILNYVLHNEGYSTIELFRSEMETWVVRKLIKLKEAKTRNEAKAVSEFVINQFQAKNKPPLGKNQIYYLNQHITRPIMTQYSNLVYRMSVFNQSKTLVGKLPAPMLAHIFSFLEFDYDPSKQALWLKLFILAAAESQDRKRLQMKAQSLTLDESDTKKAKEDKEDATMAALMDPKVAFEIEDPSISQKSDSKAEKKSSDQTSTGSSEPPLKKRRKE